jgi:hypothetical protein
MKQKRKTQKYWYLQERKYEYLNSIRVSGCGPRTAFFEYNDKPISTSSHSILQSYSTRNREPDVFTIILMYVFLELEEKAQPLM